MKGIIPAYRLFAVIMVFAAFFFAEAQTALAAARSLPFSVGQTLDPGAESPACGPTDTNCFPATATGLIQQLQFNNGSNGLGASLHLSFATSTGSLLVGTSTTIATLSVVGTSTAPTANLFALASSTGATLLSVGPGGGVTLASSTPTSTSNALYAQGSTLYWNGSALASAAGGTEGQTLVINSGGTQVATSTLFISSAGNVGIGTTSPYAKLSVPGEIVSAYFTGTTTATSTLAGGLSANIFNTTSATASSTFANGINVTAGCFAISGTCVGASGTVSSGTTGQLPYYAGSGTTLTATSSIFLATSGNFGIGATAPGEKLEVVGNIISKGTAWTSRTSAADNDWKDIAYGNGLFVAVGTTGTGNRVMTSSDGVTWTTRTSAANNSWTGVTYGQGLFVAVATSGTGNRVMTSPDGITWTTRTSAGDNDWNSVTYGNGIFVAVSSGGVSGAGNRVMTSPDGITWTLRTAAADTDWNDVIYGNGLFVAIANSGTAERVMTSPDGITWTIRGSTASTGWASVTYGNGLFVAVSNSNGIMTSPDGITWTLRTSVSGGTWSAITYGSGLFVAVGTTNTGTRVMTSPDGITWTLRNSAADNAWNGVAYGDGLFAAVSDTGTGTRVMTSGKTDTIPFSHNNILQGGLTVMGNSLSLNNIASFTTATTTFSSTGGINLTGGGCFAISGTCVGAGSGTVGSGTTGQLPYYAANGTTLTATSSIFLATSGNVGVGGTTTPWGIFSSRNTSDATAAVGRFQAAVGSYTGTSLIAENTLGAASTYNLFEAATDADGDAGGRTVKFLIRGDGNVGIGTTSPGSLLSLSGIANFTTATTTTYSSGGINLTGGGCFAISGTCVGAGGGSGTVGSGTTGQLPYYAGSGTTLTATSSIFLATSGNVGVGSSAPGEKLEVVGNIISKGTAWTSQTSAANNSWRGVVYGNGLFVTASISGTGNRVMTSPDGINWTSRTSAADNRWNSIIYGNGLFVAVADTGTGNRVMTSPDGITWTTRTSAADNEWESVTYGSGLFVAVAETGTGNRVMTSPDGITWTTRTSAADNGWHGVTYGNGLFVAVSVTGTGNRVMTSPDGITWTSRTSAADNDWESVTYGNGLFVAVSITGTGNRVMTSPDGITWTTRTSAADNSWYDITYGNGLFVAVALSGTGDRVMTSPDGITWTSRTSAADNDWRGVGYGNGLFVAVSSTGTGTRVMTSGKTDTIPFSHNNIFQGGLTVMGNSLSLNNIASFTTATTTFSSTGGINLTGGGCFAISGTCVGAGGGSGTVGSGTTGQLPYYAGSGTTLTATSSIFLATSGNVGVGTTTPGSKLTIVSAAPANGGGVRLLSDAAASYTAYQLGRVTSDGELGVSGSAIAGYSDIATAGDIVLRGTTDDLILTVYNSVGSLRFTTGGGDTQKMVLTNAGLLGIGTTSPGSLLSLSGIANFTTATSSFYSTGGINLTGGGCFAISGTCVSAGGGTVGSGTTGQLPYYAGSGTTLTATSSLFLATSGNLFLRGATDPGAGSTAPQLFLSNRGNIFHAGGLSDSSSYSYNAYVDSSGTIKYIASTKAARMIVGVNGGDIYFQSAPSGTAGNAITYSTNMVVAEGGNVGIGGTTTPWGLLSVNPSGISGPAFVIGSSTATNFMVTNAGNVGIGTTSPQRNLHISGSSFSSLAMTNTANSAGSKNFQFQLGASGELNLHMVSDDWMTIQQSMTMLRSGNVGIATTSPWRTLSVSGTAAFSGLTSSATGNALCITTAKEITDAGGGTCTPSSARFKENIQTMEAGFALDVISKMRAVSFDYKEGYYSPEDGKASLGFIAEELETIDPRLVDYGYDGLPLTIHFERLTGLAVEGVRELDKKIEGLADVSVPFVDESGADSFVGKVFKRIALWLADAGNGIVKMFAKSVETEELCVADSFGAKTCITKTELDALLAGAVGNSGTNNTTPDTDETAPQSPDIEPPVITVQGANPARIAQGSTYSDMGASVDDNSGNNLGVTAEGISAVDTSVPGSYTITYTAVDQSGNTATATREVIVYAPEEDTEEVAEEPITEEAVVEDATP